VYVLGGLKKLSTLAARQAKPAYAGYGSVGAGRLRQDSSGLNRRKSMFYQSTKLRPLEKGSGLRGQNDGSQPGLGLD
ncbi:MAG: hypothetical protein ACKO4L_16685, partial [Nodosilinea sp.]